MRCLAECPKHCWGKLLSKVMHYSIVLLHKKPRIASLSYFCIESNVLRYFCITVLSWACLFVFKVLFLANVKSFHTKSEMKIEYNSV